MVLNNTELTMIVTGANMAGYMEQNSRIAIDDDDKLTDLLVDALNKYEQWQEKNDWWDMPSWNDYIEARLLEEYG